MNLHLMEACMILAAAKNLVTVGDHSQTTQAPAKRVNTPARAETEKPRLTELAGKALTLAG